MIDSSIDDVEIQFSIASQNEHHSYAYRALAQALDQNFTLRRREQLDSWLMRHCYDLKQGELWEAKHYSKNWLEEYQKVIHELLELGVFYSDAYQVRLYHRYVDTGRITQEQQAKVHQTMLAQWQQSDHSTPVKSAKVSKVVLLIAISLPLFSLISL
ncbi:MAG: hypothetical protein HWE27_14415 [Gammaproteobacteria bacterium]|nr:hypothetical protein [Gammaproteobacteria bacterium]